MPKTEEELKKLKLQLETVISSISDKHESKKQAVKEHISSAKSDTSYKMLEEKFGKELADKLVPIVNFLAENPSAREFLRKTFKIPQIKKR